MLTLSQATSETKSFFKWGGIAIGSLIVIILLFRLVSSFIQNSKPPPPPTMSFGKLPAVVFGQNQMQSPSQYTLNTLSGKLPVFPDRIIVYKMQHADSSLLALQNAESKVSSAGFVSTPTALSETLYAWSNSAITPPQQLSLDILSYNFSLTSPYLSDPNVLTAKNLPDQPGAILFAQNFVSSITTFPTDIDPQKTQTQIFSITNGSLLPATSLSTAQVVQVNFFQSNVNNLPIVYPTGLSPMQFIVGSGQNQAQVVDAQFTHQTIGTDSATYPIKTADAAYKDLQSGKAYIVQNSVNGTNVTIKNVGLGYYIGTSQQDFLMPVVVFQGDGFTAYVSAVTDDMLQN